jgi:hypothetical protein
MKPKPQGVLIERNGTPITEASLARVWQHWMTDGFGIVSANRGERTKDENEDWYARLRRRVRDDGYGFVPLIGYWNEVSAVTGETAKQREPSLLVPAGNATPDVLRGDLIAWGLLDKSLPQESVIFAPPEGPVEFINPKTQKVTFKLAKFAPGKVADIYSQLRRSLGKEHARTFVFEGWRFAPTPTSQAEAYRRRHEGEALFIGS